LYITMDYKFVSQHRIGAIGYLEGITELVLLKCYMACRCRWVVQLWLLWLTL